MDVSTVCCSAVVSATATTAKIVSASMTSQSTNPFEAGNLQNFTGCKIPPSGWLQLGDRPENGSSRFRAEKETSAVHKDRSKKRSNAHPRVWQNHDPLTA